MELKVRKIRKEDIDTLAEINVRGWKFAYFKFFDKDYLNSLSIYDKSNRMKKNLKKNNILVVENLSQVVGYCQYIFGGNLANLFNADGEIEKFYIEPLLTNHGIGTFLFKKVIDVFLSQKKHSFVLWCFEEAEQAKQFYYKMGGKIVVKEMRKVGNKEYMDLCFKFVF